MRPRISIRGRVRPLVRRSVRRSVGWSRVIFARRKSRFSRLKMSADKKVASDVPPRYLSIYWQQIYRQPRTSIRFLLISSCQNVQQLRPLGESWFFAGSSEDDKGSVKKKWELGCSFVNLLSVLLFYSNNIQKWWIKVWFLKCLMSVLSGRTSFYPFLKTWKIFTPKFPMKYSKNGQNFTTPKNT